jgi:hypothetical protein
MKIGMQMGQLRLEVTEATPEQMRDVANRIAAGREQLEAEVAYAAQRSLQRMLPEATFRMLPLGGDDEGSEHDA